ncbi:exo-alpha-sialidase [Chlamydiifrater volucris]|uniref:exo-alpha-sialidase n=1 Tax=Chlamydiifrater volucris TaxID=2681470 RepID=UPI001BD1B2F2|nr:exo-alpha-sialidase [Chlamydiifrater volucris]
MLLRCSAFFFVLVTFFFCEVKGNEFLNEDTREYEECILSSPCSNSDRASLLDLGGRLLVVWEEDSSFGKKLSSKEYSGGAWREVNIPQEDDGTSYSNPVLAKISPKEIILFYEKCKGELAYSCAKMSSTGGRLWSDEKILPPGILGVTRNAPLVKRSLGVLYLPVYSCYPYSKKLTSSSAIWLEVVDIKLRKWKSKRGIIYSTAFDKQPKEPALVALSDGSLLLICRNHAGSSYDTGASILFSRSFDDGKSWSEIEAYPWPNPDTAVTAVYGMETLFIFANDSLIGPQNLSCFSISSLETEWNGVKQIESGYSEHPCACLDKDGYMHIVYTVRIKKTKQIKYKKISAQTLIAGDAVFSSELFD